MEQRRTESAHRHYRRTLTGLGLLLMVTPAAWADDCQLAFERWTKLSTARLRVVSKSESRDAGGRGACLPTEAVRNELLDGLARTRAACTESSANLSVQHTLLNVNQAFISALTVCTAESAHSDSAEAGAGWVTKAAPGPEKPQAAPPLPGGPRPSVITPLPGGPKLSVVPAPPKPATASSCLEIGPAQNDGYDLVNRRCGGQTVLAVIETREASGETACRGYEISQSLAVYSAKGTPPRVNHECVASQGQCNKGRLGGMFPECDWE